MKCRYPETRLALYIEGDLSGRQARAAERHLRVCPECQSAAADLRAGLDALKALARPDFSASDSDDLQRRVAAGLHAIAASPNRALRLERAVLGGFHGFNGRPALAGAAVMAALVVWMLAAPQGSHDETPQAAVAAAAICPTVVASVDRTTLTMTMPDATAIVQVRAPLSRPVSVVAAPEPPAIPAAEVDYAPPPSLLADTSAVEPQQPLLVQLFTDDPNIVIYWLVEPQGGTDELSSF